LGIFDKFKAKRSEQKNKVNEPEGDVTATHLDELVRETPSDAAHRLVDELSQNTKMCEKIGADKTHDYDALGKLRQERNKKTKMFWDNLIQTDSEQDIIELIDAFEVSMPPFGAILNPYYFEYNEKPDRESALAASWWFLCKQGADKPQATQHLCCRLIDSNPMNVLLFAGIEGIPYWEYIPLDIEYFANALPVCWERGHGLSSRHACERFLENYYLHHSEFREQIIALDGVQYMKQVDGMAEQYIRIRPVDESSIKAEILYRNGTKPKD
jgi:hypothetical protein